MSTYKSLSDQIKEIENWLRLATLLHGPLKEHLLCVLHNKNNHAYQGLPEDPTDLYTELSTVHLGTINKLKKKRILKDDQLEILLPTNGDNKTYSEAFDVTLLVVLIINCTTLPPPVNGWSKFPLDSDTSIAANVIRAREWRNFLNHIDAYAVEKTVFQTKWTEGITIIQGLGGSVNELARLKTICLDPRNDVVMRSLIDFNRRKSVLLQSKIEDIRNKFDKEIKQTKEQMVASIDDATDKIDEKIDNVNDKVDGNTKHISDMYVEQNELIENHDHLMRQLQSLSNEVEQLKILKKESTETESCTGKLFILHYNFCI